MDIEFLPAKNNEQTVKVQNLFLHSSYNPSKEAERFVETLSLPYTPKLIIILEPALSYICPLIKNKFPGIKIGVIRYINNFENFNINFDLVLNFYEHSNDFSNYLFYKLGEELLLSTYFISWQPSAKAFQQIDNNCWLAIKSSMEQAKTLLVTRQYFEKKWLINTCNNLKYIKKTIRFSKKIDKPILIISSGPSLQPAISIIKQKRNKFFILCLSSAISVCIKNDIIPDLFMSTDGGFWAGEHLKKIIKTDVPLAIPTEAFCKKSLLKNIRILPLKYDDGISNSFISLSGLECEHAFRNGTVSGTALQFAIEHSINMPIYFCGLDMSNQKGFQHTQPNEIELNNCTNDNYIKSKELRSIRAEFSKSSLDIYKNWFENFNLNGHEVYRIIDTEYKNNSLGQIKDISSQEFEKHTLKIQEKQSSELFEKIDYKFSSNKLLDYINNNCNSEEWKKQIFPADIVSLNHNKTDELENKIQERNLKLINKLKDILND